jgi:hypothetical protein
MPIGSPEKESMIHINPYTHVQKPHIHTHTYTHAYTHTHTHTKHPYTHIHTHTHTYTHTYTHTHTHTQLSSGAITKQAYSVLHDQKTERPNTSPLNNEKRKGVFTCAA